MTRIGVLLSGRGSNFLALNEAVLKGDLGNTEIAVVLSNVEDAPGISKARDLGLATEVIPHRGLKRANHDALMVEALRAASVDWVCLAGYMRLLTPVLVEAFPQRILNIHPSLLPSFPGLRAQEQAWQYGAAISGCTVHLVDEGMDTGPIVAQAAVHIGDAVSPAETSERILKEEHILYPLALRRLLEEDWRIEGRRVVFGVI